MQRAADFIRERLRSLIPPFDPMSPAELNRRAREVVDAIDDETGDRTSHAQRVAQIYGVARQIQRAGEKQCGEMTVYRIIAFLFEVCKRSYLPRLVPR